MASLGFVGLGSMGLPMARNLIQAGHSLKVYNRSSTKALALVDLGAHLAALPVDVAEPGGVVISMLADDAALLNLSAGPHGFGGALGRGGLHISMSTVDPSTNRKLGSELEALGGALVAAPVFGRPDAAAAAKLFIPYSGPTWAKERALPFLKALGQGATDFGPEIGAANLVKLGGNYLLLAATQAIAECLAVAEAGGVDRRAAMDFLSATVFACPAYINYGKRIAARDYALGGFKLSLGAKDLGLFAGQKGATGLPLSGLLNERLAKALEAGQGDWDVTAVCTQVDETEAGPGREAAGGRTGTVKLRP